MAAQTLNDVLIKTREFHSKLAASLDRSGDENDSDRARMLLDYLSDHEQKLAHALEVLQQSADLKQLDTWFYEFTQKHNVIQSEPHHESFSKMNTIDIMHEIMEEHEQVIQLYRYLYGRAGTSPAKDLLGQLVDLEQHEAMLLSQQGNRAEDM